MPERRPRHPLPVVTSLLILTFVLAQHASAGLNAWTSGGPQAGGTFVRVLALDPAQPSTLFAGTQLAGVYRSLDGGGSWSAANVGLADLNVFALAVDPLSPATLYAGSEHAGVFKSVDGGDTWTSASVGLTASWVIALAVDPVTPSIVYAGTAGGGVFKSVDAAATWTPASLGLTAMTVNALAIDPTTPTTLYVGTTGGGVAKSTDGAATWTMVSPGWTVWTVAVDPEAPTTLYAGMFSVGAYKSVDGGQSWTAANTGLTAATVRMITVDPTTPSSLLAGTPSDGVFRSQDAGASWAPLNAGLGNLVVPSVLIDPLTPTVFHAATLGGGVFDYELNACDDGGTPVVCQACETCSPAFGCVGEVWTGCHQPLLPHKTKLHIKDKSPDARDRVVWKWLRGEATSFVDYGDPLTDTSYTLCIFDQSQDPARVALHATVPAGGDCGPKPCWREVGGRRYKYRNGDGSPEGISKLLLNEGEDEQAKIILKGHGDLLDLPTLPLSLPLRLQLRASNGQCWEGLFTENGNIQNNDQLFVGASGL